MSSEESEGAGQEPDNLGEKRREKIRRIIMAHYDPDPEALDYFLSRINLLAGTEFSFDQEEARKIEKKAKKILDLAETLNKEIASFRESVSFPPVNIHKTRIDKNSWRGGVYILLHAGQDLSPFLAGITTTLKGWPQNIPGRKTPRTFMGEDVEGLRFAIFQLAVEFQALNIPGWEPTFSKDGKGKGSPFQQIVHILFGPVGHSTVRQAIQKFHNRNTLPE